MVNLKNAVSLTQRYAAFFHGVLSDAELHHWLISDKIYSARNLKKLFPQKPKVHPSHSIPKLALARRVAKILSFIPTVSMTAVTGSLAVNNAKPEDDIDLMIITKPNTLWLTRLVVVPLITLFFKRRYPSNEQWAMSNDKWSNSICSNLWLDESALAVPKNKRNLYTAHEVLQALPVFDRNGTYYHFIKQNSWTKKYLANAYKIALSSLENSKIENSLKTENWLLKIPNTLAFRLQYLYMKRRITGETISLHAAYFHPRNLSQKLNQALGIY